MNDVHMPRSKAKTDASARSVVITARNMLIVRETWTLSPVTCSTFVC